MSESAAVSKLRTVGEHIELDVGDDIALSPRYNDDIAPTRASQRTWTRWNVASLWVGMAICVPTYTLGGVLTAYFGLSVAEALWTILIANIVVLIPLTLNAFPGTRYGIPCPVVMRASFGIIGSNVPSLIRAVVACGWFGIQTLFGGIAIHLMFSAMFDGWAALGGVGISLSEVLSTPATRPPGEPFFGYFMAGLTAMVGFWATLSLNIPDFSRYARTQRSQVFGQIIGLPLTMLLFAGLGVVLTAASVELTGETISDPINLIGRIDNDFWVVIAMLMIILATISTNTAANIVSPTNVFQNVAPKIINEDRGVLITGFIGIALMSWELLKKMGWLDTDVSVESLYSNWLLGYSSLLGPIAGIMIIDYFLIKKQAYNLLALYQDNAGYPAWNTSGFIAFLVPVALTIVAITTDYLSWFYDYGWFTGSILGGIIYYFVARGEIGSSS
jgi:NCS1 family nucleobase:cation symporter-1